MHISNERDADNLFNLQILTIKAEGELSDLLDSLSKPFDWADFAYDYYDASLSIYGVPETYKLCGADHTKLKNYGFRRVWMHTVDGPDGYNTTTSRANQGERYYNI